MLNYDNIILSGGLVQFLVISFLIIITLWKVISWFLNLKEKGNHHIRMIAKEEIDHSLVPIKDELEKLSNRLTNSNDLTRKEIARTNTLIENLTKQLTAQQVKNTEQLVKIGQCVVRLEERVNHVQTGYEKLTSK